MVNTKYSEDEISAMLAESRKARKHLRKLGRVMKTVVAHRLKEPTHLQAVEKLATWTRTYGLDRLADGDDSWVHGPLPPTPEHITASLWSDLNELKYLDRGQRGLFTKLNKAQWASRTKNSPCSNGSWRGEAATRRM